MLLHRAHTCTHSVCCRVCVYVVHKLHWLVGWGGIISAGGPALPAFQRGISSIADADDNRDTKDARDDERFSLNVYKFFWLFAIFVKSGLFTNILQRSYDEMEVEAG